MTQLKQQEQIHPSFAFWSIQPLSELKMPIHIGESDLLYSVYQYKC